MGFNLDNYEPVEARLARFWHDHPQGRVLTELVSHTDKQFIVRADVYFDREDTRPTASGFAEEIVSNSGVNKTSALENCETSAIGRALANANYQTDKRPSRQEMEKVQRGSRNVSAPAPAASPEGSWSTEQLEGAVVLLNGITTLDELREFWGIYKGALDIEFVSGDARRTLRGLVDDKRKEIGA